MFGLLLLSLRTPANFMVPPLLATYLLRASLNVLDLALQLGVELPSWLGGSGLVLRLGGARAGIHTCTPAMGVCAHTRILLTCASSFVCRFKPAISFEKSKGRQLILT